MDNNFFRSLSDKLTSIAEESSETEDAGELRIGQYQTRHFDMCPSATQLYKNIDEKTNNDDLAERTAKLHDVLFYLEKHTVKEMKSATEEDVRMAEILADQIMTMAEMMGLVEDHDYIQSHVDAIKDVVENSDSTQENAEMKIYELEDEEITLEDTQDFHEEFGYLGYSIDESDLFEAEYQGRKVKLNKPMAGDVKKFKVYVNSGDKTADGKIKAKKVNFGQKGARIKKDDPDARASFRARHNCDNPGPKTKARYWSCRKW